MMRKRGRPVVGAISGFFLGLLLAIDLLLFSVVALDSILVLVLPILGLVVGIALPLIARRSAAGATTPEVTRAGATPPPTGDYVAAAPPNDEAPDATTGAPGEPAPSS